MDHSASSFWKRYSLGIRELPINKVYQKYSDANSLWECIDGLDVHYKDEGTGPALLLLHGVLSSLNDWDAWAEELKEHYRVLRLDLPGFGLTGPANFRWCETELTRFLYKFIKAMKVEECYVAGNSMGGYLAWNAVLKNSDVIKKLILVDAIGYPIKTPGPLKFFTTPILDHVTARITPRWIFDQSISSVFSKEYKVDEKIRDRYYEMHLRKGNRDSAKKILKYLGGVMCDYPVHIKQIKIPTLIMWGAKDRWVPLKAAKMFRKDIPHAKVIVYEGVGHIPMIEVPQRSALDAHQFLSEK